jgi:flagellar biosynthesis protein FlhA
VTDVERKNAEISGYTVVDAASVLVTHLTETIKRNCHELLSRQDVQGLLDHLKQTNPTVVTELIPGQLTVGQVQRVLQNLLAEGVSIRNLGSILEKVSDHAHLTKNPDELSEHARRALGSQITKPYQDEHGKLRVITLEPKLEQQILQGVRQTPTELSLLMDPKLARHVMDSLSQRVQSMLADGLPPVVLTAPHLRLPFRRFFETTFTDLTVLSFAEIPPRVEIQNAAVIGSPD